MWVESDEQARPLRSGLTTGTCATACCVAAMEALFKNSQPEQVSVKLPRGKTVQLTICDYQYDNQYDNQYDQYDDRNSIRKQVKTATIKDAGDDPDITHGAKVFVELTLTQTEGIHFKAAEGVGTVTKEGLLLAVGEPAINPVPRQMMRDHITQCALEQGYQGGVEVAVGVEQGAALAKKTMNPRLGILGGLSILGTTGIVRPFSCAAYIASIHQSIDVARANGIHHMAAVTGSSSEAAIRDHYGFEAIAIIEMGDFVGAVLKYLKRVPIGRVTLCGGFGKISKLAKGHLDLHSRASSIDVHHLAQVAKALGGDDALLQAIVSANTTAEVITLCQQAGIAMGDAICRLALQRAQNVVPKTIMLDVYAIDRQGRFVGSAIGGSAIESGGA